jgi:hypothetical protein
MNKEKQRIAIAEACGFKCSEYSHELGQLVAEFTPDYLNDLNAMAEAETCEAIQRVGYAKYIECLAIACGTERLGALVFATAAQRAEAFLRTIGKWEEDK